MKVAIRIVVICAVTAFLSGCTKCGDATNDKEAQAAWQQYNEVRTKGLEPTLAVIDSMEQSKIVSPAKAHYLRGRAYDAGWQMRIAEYCYRKAYEGFAADPSENMRDYADAGYRWAYLRYTRGDTGGAMTIVTALLSQAEGDATFPKRVEASLLMLLADCQVSSHQNDEARHNWQKAYEVQQQVAKTSQNADIPWVSITISSSLYKMGDTAGAQMWLERAAEEFALYEQRGDSLIVEEWKGHIALLRARYLLATGHVAEAAATYAAVPRSRIFEPNGYVAAAEYLMDAGRFDEAVYWYEQLDSTYAANDSARTSFDHIASSLSPRYLAYRKAGRNGDALVIADRITTAIDSALVWQKENDAGELAVIYQTHKRDLQLSDLRFMIRLHRLLIVAGLVIIALVVYLNWRVRKYNKVLTAKNRGLYEQIQQLEQAEAGKREQMEAQPAETLSQNQQIYCRLCELMKNPEVYTDVETNHETLARLISTNRTYINEALRKCANLTPADFINQYRIRHAARLLATTDDPIGLIIEQSGFTNRATFSRLFREHYSMTPSEYRQAAG